MTNEELAAVANGLSAMALTHRMPDDDTLHAWRQIVRGADIEYVVIRGDLATLRRDLESCRIALRAANEALQHVGYYSQYAAVRDMIAAALGDGGVGREGGADGD